jgi:hypothetical protein
MSLKICSYFVIFGKVVNVGPVNGIDAKFSTVRECTPTSKNDLYDAFN